MTAARGGPARKPPLTEIPVTLAALALAAGVELGLRTLSLPRLAGLVGAPLALDAAEAGLAPTSPQGDAQWTLPSAARRRIAATRRVLRHWPFGDSCLRQALVSGSLLRRFHPRLQVGVAKVDGEVRAHAWLVIAGSIIDPRRAATSYLPLTSIPNGLDR